MKRLLLPLLAALTLPTAVNAGYKADIDLTLQSPNYQRKEIKNVLPILIKDIEKNENLTKEKKKISFEKFLNLAMNNLDNNTNNSN